ncbi:hypothetical protein U6Y00_12180, partial [Cutibacterium acnes]
SLMGEEGGEETTVEAAVVVVPNGTSQKNCDAVALVCRGERSRLKAAKVLVAKVWEGVAAAYADKVKPSKVKTLAIVSTTEGVIDLNVISVHPRYLLREQYDFKLEARVEHLENTTINFAKLNELDQIFSQQLFSLLSKIPVIGSLLDNTKDIYSSIMAEVKNTLLRNPDLKKPSAAAVDAIVFVSSEPALISLREMVKMMYPKATVWDDIDADEIAAHGGAVLALDSTKPPPPLPPPRKETPKNSDSDDEDDETEDEPNINDYEFTEDDIRDAADELKKTIGNEI